MWLKACSLASALRLQAVFVKGRGSEVAFSVLLLSSLEYQPVLILSRLRLQWEPAGIEIASIPGRLILMRPGIEASIEMIYIPY